MSLHRRRRLRVRGALLACLALALSGFSSGKSLVRAATDSDDSPTGGLPNILLIMTDQQHAGMMSCAGNPYLKTPAMDGLARDGVRFTRAYAANPVCVPSRTSMATGMMPGRLGVFNNGMKADVPPEVEAHSLGKLIKSAGYDTFYGGKVHMCAELAPLRAGYDEYYKDQRDGLPAACIEFIEREREKPFFVVASFINPHDICFAYSAYRGKSPKGKQSVEHLYRQAAALPLDELPPLPPNYAIPPNEPQSIESNLSPRAVTPAGTMRKEYDERQWRIYRWIYCRLTEQVDRHIGQILDALQRNGLEDKTLIVFTSDHGNMDASHRLASKGLFYEESVGVPLLMKYQGTIPAGRIDDHLICNGLDILPTLCDYAGVAVPEQLAGRSLRQIAEGQQVDSWRRYVVSENGTGRMIRSPRYKYCVYTEGTARESLVDFERDPGEMKNVAALPEYQDALLEHRGYLQQWIEDSGDEEARSFAVNRVGEKRQ
jgi:arylsulfatase A-like enzyme